MCAHTVHSHNKRGRSIRTVITEGSVAKANISDTASYFLPTLLRADGLESHPSFSTLPSRSVRVALPPPYGFIGKDGKTLFYFQKVPREQKILADYINFLTKGR